jgi:hypothetical protein
MRVKGVGSEGKQRVKKREDEDVGSEEEYGNN